MQFSFFFPSDKQVGFTLQRERNKMKTVFHLLYLDDHGTRRLGLLRIGTCSTIKKKLVRWETIKKIYSKLSWLDVEWMLVSSP